MDQLVIVVSAVDNAHTAQQRALDHLISAQHPC